MQLAYQDLMRLLIALVLMQQTLQHCYELKMFNFRTTDSPDYRFEMTLHANQTLSSITRVLKPVAVPMWRIALVQHSSGAKNALGKVEPPKTLYNSTYKVCEFWRYVKRIRVFNNVAHMLFTKNGGNMSLSCPMEVGTYVMQNIHVPPDTVMLKFMYWPDTLYTLFGTVFAQQPDKSLVMKASYDINATVKKLC